MNNEQNTTTQRYDENNDKQEWQPAGTINAAPSWDWVMMRAAAGDELCRAEIIRAAKVCGCWPQIEAEIAASGVAETLAELSQVTCERVVKDENGNGRIAFNLHGVTFGNIHEYTVKGTNWVTVEADARDHNGKRTTLSVTLFTADGKQWGRQRGRPKKGDDRKTHLKLLEAEQ